MANEKSSDAAQLRAAVAALQRRLRAQDENVGVGPTGFLILMRLSREGVSSASELARLERLQPQSLTRALKALEDAELIERSVDENDRRRAPIGITKRGRELLRRFALKRVAWLARAIDTQLAPDERETLRAGARLIERIASGEGGDVAPSDVVFNIVPALDVSNVHRSLEFYHRLGFVEDARWERKGVLAWVSLHARTVRSARIMLRLANAPIDPDAQRVAFACWSDDVARLRERLIAEGLTPGRIRHPSYMPNGEFALTDPDGYALTVGQVR